MQVQPRSVVFYASGRASLEASYLYQLLARLYGNNNLPDSSNMCHESTSVALPKTIGSAVASDAFFPFADGLEILIAGGVRAVVQPGGSVRDPEVIAAAEAAGISMYLTGTRHFFH